MAAETSQTLDRGLRVLEVLAAAPDGMSITEIAGSLQVSRTVVYRLVATLEQHAFLRRTHDGRCMLGMSLISLARAVQPVLRDAALPALRRLANHVGATAHLSVVDGGEALAVAVVKPARSEQQVAYRVGYRQGLDRGAAGRAMLMARRRGGRPSEPAWVVSAGDAQPGALAVAAPVLGVSGVEASVGVVALGGVDVQHVGPHVARAAHEVGRALR